MDIKTNGRNEQPKSIPLAQGHTRPPLTEEQRKRFQDNLSRTVFVASEGNVLHKLFRTKPVQLFKEITAQAGGEVIQTVRTDKGLRILTQNEAQKNRLLKLNNLCGSTVTVSLPYSLSKTHLSVPIRKEGISTKEVTYLVKGVVYGIDEDEENLTEFAQAIGAVELKKIGNPQTSRTTLITFKQGIVLPSVIQAFGRKFKVHEYIPKPMRCHQCQRFGHTKLQCTNRIICPSCSENHLYDSCPNKDIKKCVNCHENHSSAHRGCPKYIKTQEILKIRAIQKVSYAEATKRHLNQNKPVALNTESHHTSVADTPNDTEDINNRDNFVDQIIDDTKPVPSHGPNTKEFLDFNYSNYKAINVAQPNKTYIEEFDPLTCKLMTFVLGVLAAIDKSKDKQVVKNIICDVASDFLFDGEIQFRWRA